MKVDNFRRLVVDVMKSKAEAEMQMAGRAFAAWKNVDAERAAREARAAGDLLYAPVFEYLSNIKKSNEAAE